MKFLEMKTMHELLRLAIDDLKAVAKTGIRIDMYVWLHPDCACCMAGAVLMNAVFKDRIRGNEWNDHLYCNDKPIVGSSRLFCINQLRRGDLQEASFYFYGKINTSLTSYIPVPKYVGDGAEFFCAMETIYGILKEHDL